MSQILAGESIFLIHCILDSFWGRRQSWYREADKAKGGKGNKYIHTWSDSASVVIKFVIFPVWNFFRPSLVSLRDFLNTAAIYQGRNSSAERNTLKTSVIAFHKHSNRDFATKIAQENWGETFSLPVQTWAGNQHASHFGNIELHIEPPIPENVNINIKRYDSLRQCHILNYIKQNPSHAKVIKTKTSRICVRRTITPT